MITNIGTLGINLEDLIQEWKTVVISLFAIAGDYTDLFYSGFPCCSEE